MTSPFTPIPSFSPSFPLPPLTGSLCAQYFGNDKKYICSPRDGCQLPIGQFQLFLSCDCIYRLVI